MAQTAQLIQMLASGVVTSAGVAVASGKVRFYNPETLVAATVYSDSQATTAITPPLTLTAGGTGTVYSVVPLRIIIKDATDTTTLYDLNVSPLTEDSVYVKSASFNGGSETTLATVLDAVTTSFGGTDWKYKHSSSATERTLKAWMSEAHISVKDFGALGDDSNDDTAEIQAAINAAIAGSAVVYVPPGTYRISSALTASAGVRIVGASASTAIIKQMSTTANGITYSGSGVLAVEDLTFSCDTVSTGTALSVASGVLQVNRISSSSDYKKIVTLASNAGTHVLQNSSMTTSNDAASVGVTVSTNAPCIIIGCDINAFLDAVAVTGADAAITIVGGVIRGLSSGDGIDISAANVALSVAGTLIGGTVSLRLPNQTGVVWQDAGARYESAVVDGRTGTPVAFILAGTNSVTPLPLSSPTTKIVQSGAAATTTINAPADGYWGMLHTVVCSNTSGGALTWTWNAAFKISAAVAPATGNRISVTFYYDPADDKWSEISRSAAVPN